jgi:hypothetical protein
MTSGKKAQYCNLIQQARFIINYFKDYKPNKFLFGSKWTMFYNADIHAILPWFDLERLGLKPQGKDWEK